MPRIHSAPANRLLDLLSDDDASLLQPLLAPVDLPVRHRLADAGRPIEHVYFLGSGIASLVMGIRHAPPIEIGIIGREGVVNLAVVLGSSRAASDAFMQIGGHGQAVRTDRLREILEASPTLRELLTRYAHVFMVQMSSTVLANGHASIGERLARWLLMAHDRVDGDLLPLTHEFLSVMLGIRRPSVTDALREFDRRGLIERRRGSVQLRDRGGLIVQANGYYGAAEDEFRRLFGGTTAA